MKRKTWFIILIGAVILGLYIFRVYALNKDYERVHGITDKEYNISEMVPFEEDISVGNEILDGYSIRVDNAEYMDIKEFMKKYAITGDMLIEAAPERVFAVDISIKNESSQAEGIYLPDIILHGVDFYVDWNAELIDLANPELDGVLGVTVASEKEAVIHMVYNLRKMHFTNAVWDNMDKEEFWLQLTVSPNRKEIKLQGL